MGDCEKRSDETSSIRTSLHKGMVPDGQARDVVFIVVTFCQMIDPMKTNPIFKHAVTTSALMGMTRYGSNDVART